MLPLRDKLGDLDCWITGLRRQQSDTRAGIGIIELYAFDEDIGPGHCEAEPDGQLDARGGLEVHARPQDSLQPAARPGLRLDRLPALHPQTGNGENERAGRWTGFNKVECGIHTFMPKKVDFQI